MNPRSLYIRGFLFDRSMRTLFFTSLAECEASNLSMLDSLKTMIEASDNRALTEVCETCLESIYAREPLAKRATERGYFSVEEGALLTVGEKYTKVGKMCELILTKMNSGASKYYQMLAGKVELFFSAIVLIIIAYSLRDAHFGGEQDTALKVVEWVVENAAFIVLTMAGIGVAYVNVRDKMSGGVRNHLKRYGLFKLADQDCEYEFLRVCGFLAETQVEPSEIYDVAIEMLYANEEFSHRLYEGRRTLTTMDFAKGLRNVLSGQSYAFVRSKSPNGALTEVGAGCHLAGRQLNMLMDRQLERLSLYINAVSYSVMFYVALPVLRLISGVGMPI